MISTTPIDDKPPRERILLTAHDLFYLNGIRATGIDKVIAESGVTKVTFYRHFPSKNDLIRAFLDYRHRRWMAWFTDALTRQGGRPAGGLSPLVGTMEEWFTNPVYRGCAFINIVAELGDSVADVLTICRSHKQDMVNVIAELLPETESRQGLANAAAVAIDGAIVTAQMASNPGDSELALQSLALILTALDRSVPSQPAPT